jgi:hypothetical protein
MLGALAFARSRAGSLSCARGRDCLILSKQADPSQFSLIDLQKEKKRVKKWGCALHPIRAVHAAPKSKKRNKTSIMPSPCRATLFQRILSRDSVFRLAAAMRISDAVYPCRDTLCGDFLSCDSVFSTYSPPGVSIVVNFRRDTVLVSFSTAVST